MSVTVYAHHPEVVYRKLEEAALVLVERNRVALQYADEHYAMGRCDWCNRPAGATVTDTDTGNIFQTCEKHMQHTYDFAQCAWQRHVHGLDNRGRH